MINQKYRLVWILATVAFICFANPRSSLANMPSKRLVPGEKLTYELRWENIPAGVLELQIQTITTIEGTRAYHFVMSAKSNSVVDFFIKIRDRIDAYANTQMTHSIYYQKGQYGERKRQEVLKFDWESNLVHYTDSGQVYDPIELKPGSFDPLSAFYFTRMTISETNPEVQRPVTDGKRSFLGSTRMVRRETITLNNGKSYDTFCLQPDLGLFGGIFKESKNPQLFVWITADEKRIPVQIKSKVKVGHFIGELISAESAGK